MPADNALETLRAVAVTQQTLFLPFGPSWVGIAVGLPEYLTVMGITWCEEELPTTPSQSPRLSSFMMEKPTCQQQRAPPGRDPGGSLECDILFKKWV